MTRTSSILFWFSLIIIASLGLYRTSDRVQELDRQMRDINASIVVEKQSIHVLNAEWVYLTNPERMGEISRKHLTLRPTMPQQVATLDTFAEILPTHAESMTNVSVNTPPTANVKTTLVARMTTSPVVTASHVVKVKPAMTTASLEMPIHDTAHVRDHMIMVQRTASAAPLPGDEIGNLIGQLNADR